MIKEKEIRRSYFKIQIHASIALVHGATDRNVLQQNTILLPVAEHTMKG